MTLKLIFQLSCESTLWRYIMKGLLKVLLVEDSDLSAVLTQNMLEQSKNYEYIEYIFELTHVHKLGEAISALAEKYYDVVLLDLNLPDSMGIETLKSLVQYNPDIPIIVMSAMDDFKLSYDTIKYGAQDYLIKGCYDINMLIRSIYYSIERFNMVAALKQLALIDDLTGLFNRRAFMNLAEHQIKMAKRKKFNIFFVFSDLDEFKNINDNFGHSEGDIVLKEFSNVLKESFRESDIIARYAGDEFIISAIDVKQEDQDIITKRLLDNLRIKNEQLNKPYKINTSLGFVLFTPETESTLYDIIDQIDTLMYEEKKRKVLLKALENKKESKKS